MKKAFTLIELLVYMAIMSFIIVVAGRAFSDSTSMRVRTQNMTKATEEVNKMAAILKEDISQMGSKSWRDNSDNFVVAEKVYYNLTSTPPDSSSYNLDNSNTNWHKFIFHKVHYKDDGTCGAVLKITWEVKPDSSLWRRCEQLDDTKCPKSVSISKDECPDSLAMATGVEKFTLLPSKPVNPIVLFGGPSTTGAPTFKLIDRGNQTQVKGLNSPINPDGNKVTISGFRLNEPNEKFLNQVLVGDPNTSICKKFQFKKDTVYAIQFRTPISRNANNVPDEMALFKPGNDHIAVGLAKYANFDDVFKRFIFWPPQTNNSDEQNHYMEFSLPTPQETCVAFEFSFYKPNSIAYNGALIIEDFEVTQKNDKAYSFEGSYTISPVDKKNVKAFKLDTLKVKRKSEIGSIAGMVIQTPNNGIKATATEASP